MPWGYAITPYLAGHLITGPGAAWEAIFNGIYRCPDDRRRDVYGYGKNVWFELTSQETGEVMEIDNGPTYPRISNVPRPGATILYGELASGSMADHIMAHFWYFGGKPEVDEKRHGRTSNYVFVDGHGEARQFRSTFDPNAAKDPGTRNDPNTWVDLWDPAKAN
jgi:prepilin-type processing-associated H-X9-DG protein